MEARELGFVTTIGEDDDISIESESSISDNEGVKIKKKKKSKKKNKSEDFIDSFSFEDQDDDFEQWGEDFALKYAKKKVETTTLDEKIARIRRKTKKQENTEVCENGDHEEEKEAEDEESEEYSSSGEEIKLDTIKDKRKKKKKKKKGNIEEDAEAEKIRFAQEITEYEDGVNFQDMNLSRPLMKALSTMGFQKPMPIQAATIPVALMGKDICACAATGTGKTAAFMLPVLERLLYKPKQAAVTRVLVLTPTRELAIQIHQVTRQLAQYSNIEINLSAGGFDVRAQEAALRFGPDVVIATPGRLIDHLHNAINFNLQNIEILILDEADRMLDEYFAEQMKEVIRLCSPTRQTMLFSATMTEQVQELAAVSLKDPVKIFLNENTDVALRLRQEFVRMRSNREGDREATVAALVKRNFSDHCMVFIQTKRLAHRMHCVLGLLGIKAGELHGDLSQAQRIESLKHFKEGDTDVLLSTDLAARGLDIPNVKTVINFTMPSSLKHYIHRVGRTARAGKAGRSVSLVGEKERKLLKEVVKRATNPVKSRVVAQEVVLKFRDKISSLEKDIEAIMLQEKEEKELRMSEMHLKRAENLIEHREAIMSRPKRTWFQTTKEQKQEAASLRLEQLKPGKKQPGKKTWTPEERVQFELKKTTEYSARHAKKQTREKRKRTFRQDGDGLSQPQAKRKKKTSTFDKELTSTSKKALKQFRAGPSYQDKKKQGMQKKHKGGKPKTNNRKRR